MRHGRGRVGPGVGVGLVRSHPVQTLLLFFSSFFGFSPWQADEDRSPEGTQEISWNQGSELSDAMSVPQGDVVAYMTRSEDKLILIPGNAVGTATPVGIPVCYWSTKKTEG